MGNRPHALQRGAAGREALGQDGSPPLAGRSLAPTCVHGGQELRPSAGPHPKTEEDAGAATSWGRGHMTDTPLLPAPFSGQTTRAPNPDTGGPEAQGGYAALATLSSVPFRRAVTEAVFS